MKATTEIRERERERGNMGDAMGDAGNRNRKSSVAGEAEAAEAESRQVTGDMDMEPGA